MEHVAASLTDITLVANMVETGKTPLLTPDELAAMGFRLIVSPLTALFTMVSSIRQSLEILARQGTLRDDLDRLVTFDDFATLVGLAEQNAAAERYNADT